MADSEVLVPLATGIIPAVIASGFAWFVARRKRADDLDDANFAATEKMRAGVDAQALAINQRLVEENTRLVAQLRAVEADRDAGWNAGRAMERVAHLIAHDWRGKLTVANGRLEAAGLKTVAEPEREIPTLQQMADDLRTRLAT